MVPRRNLASANSAAAPRILIVDDEPYMCDVCSRTLQRGGYEVVSTSDPQAAAAMLRSEEHFDLLLTDIKMPSISGLELAYIAREQDPTIAIIIMTGFATMENLQQSVQRGIADFLSKPFELEHLHIAHHEFQQFGRLIWYGWFFKQFLFVIDFGVDIRR